MLGKEENELKLEFQKSREEIEFEVKHTFSKKYRESVKLNEAIKILGKPTNDRSDKDIYFLSKEFENLNFFRDLVKNHGNEVLFECCKFFVYKKYEEGEVLFEEGDFGEEFYIILYGSIGINLWIDPFETSKAVIESTPKKNQKNEQEEDYFFYDEDDYVEDKRTFTERLFDEEENPTMQNFSMLVSGFHTVSPTRTKNSIYLMDNLLKQYQNKGKNEMTKEYKN